MQLVFILSFAVISPAFGWLGDRRARFPLAAIGVFVWSAATVRLRAWPPRSRCCCVARALTAVGEASYTVVTPSLISDFYPVDRRGRALALFYAAIPIGSAVGFMVGGAINAHWGWRAAFFVAGAPGAALAAVLLMFRDPARGTLRRGQGAGARARRATPSRALQARPSYIYNTVAQIIYTFAVGGLAFWMPTYFVEVRRLPLEVGVAQLRRRAGAGRFRRDADRRARGRCARAPAPATAISCCQAWPSSRRCRSRCSRSFTPRLLSSGRRCS